MTKKTERLRDYLKALDRDPHVAPTVVAVELRRPARVIVQSAHLDRLNMAASLAESRGLLVTRSESNPTIFTVSISAGGPPMR